jgi:uncharacterized RDD family membrane protein YckC
MICPACKDQYAQKLREGAARPAAAGYAGFWIRVVAYLIDVIILGIVGGVLQLGVVGSLVGFPRIQPGQPPDVDAISRMMGTFGLLFVLQTAIASCYEAFFVSKLAATPGKLVIGAKVLRPDGSPVSLGRAFGRYFAKYLSTLALFIGFIMVGFDSQKRGLHDMICDTRVFRSRS